FRGTCHPDKVTHQTKNWVGDSLPPFYYSVRTSICYYSHTAPSEDLPLCMYTVAQCQAGRKRFILPYSQNFCPHSRSLAQNLDSVPRIKLDKSPARWRFRLILGREIQGFKTRTFPARWPNLL